MRKPISNGKRKMKYRERLTDEKNREIRMEIKRGKEINRQLSN